MELFDETVDEVVEQLPDPVRLLGATYGHDGRIKQILLNLLSNAVEYNQPGGSVQLACQSIQDQRLDVRQLLGILDNP